MPTNNLATVYSAELEGINARLVEIEIDLHVGIREFNIVGLADKALREARERVNSALKNSGLKPPNRENRKIIINLAPADLRKTGTQYDLAIALGYLMAGKQIPRLDVRDKLFLGELALDGRLRPISGSLSITQMARDKNFRTIFVPYENSGEAFAIENITVVPIRNLNEAIDVLLGGKSATASQVVPSPAKKLPQIDFSEILGQESAKRALIIAAAGGHNIAMSGPPGIGKSMLVQALDGVLPDLERDEAIEVTKIWSAAGLQPEGLIRERPLRAPHHTASVTSLIGGGAEPRPGEISLAHHGVLFLDETPEFKREALEALRQPIETGRIPISRAKGTTWFPSKFILVLAMNPCPCGYFGDPQKECVCSAYEIAKYQKRISGPLLDRIDMQFKVGRVAVPELKHESGPDESANIKRRIILIRDRQRERFQGMSKTNGEMTSREVRRHIEGDPSALKFLDGLRAKNLSPRSFYRLLKVARTIADLEESRATKAEHIAEAFGYRLRGD